MDTANIQVNTNANGRSPIRKKRMLTWLTRLMATVLLGSSLVGMAGCTIPGIGPRVVVEPRLMSETNIEGTIQGADLPAASVSPDGSYFLAVKDDAQGSHLVIIPVDHENFKVIPVESVSKDWLSGSWFSYRPLGWTSDSEFVYAKMGWQPSGTHKSERGVALAVGSLSGEIGKPESETQPGSDDPTVKASTEEAAFFPLPYRDSSLRTLFLPGQKHIYLNNNTTIWRFDIAERTLVVLKEDLPDYIYRQPIASPNGDYFVYELNEKGKSGIFIFNTATGEERPLLPNGDTMRFYPAWSFDGKYIAAYTVGRKEGATGTSWHDYLLFEGEDTAQSIGSSITVVNTKGEIVETVQIEGKYLQNFRWSDNNHTIGFVAGSTIESQSPGNKVHYRSTLCDSVWMARIGKASKQAETLVHLGDVPKDGDGHPPYTWPVAFDTDTKGIFCNVYGNGVWYFGEDAEPVKVVDGLWPVFAGETTPTYGGSVVALVDTAEIKKEFYLFDGGQGGQSTEFGQSESPWAWVVASTDSKLILFCGDLPENPEEGTTGYLAYPKKGRLSVYNMIKP